MIKAVIFDIDGTIVDAYDSIHEALQRTLTDLGYARTTYEESKRAVGHGVEYLLGSFVKEDHIPKALELYTKHTDDVLKDTVKFLPGAFELITDLHDKGYKLAIASNRPHQFSKRILECLEIEHLFHEVVCADNVPEAKPAPDVLIEVLKRFDLSNEQALYVGDMIVDVETGRRAGVVTLAIPTGSSTREEILASDPHTVIEHLSEVGPIIDKLSHR